MVKIKVALFDIDKTIIKKDSMFLFLCFGIKKAPKTILNLLPVFIFTVLYKLRIVSAEKVKEYYFYAIKYLNEKDLREFYLILNKYIFADAIEELKKRKKEGYYNLLVSASPNAYLKYFKELQFVDEVLATELEYNNGSYKNIINGRNCKGEEKVNRINMHLGQLGYGIDYDNSYAYSDSLSDIPMFSLVKNRFVVNNQKNNGDDMKVIIWK